MAACPILVMASGNGSNFQALLDALAADRLPSASITHLVTNRARAHATARADAAGVPWTYFNPVSQGFLAAGERDAARVTAGRAAYDAALAEKVLALRPRLVVLAGWMHVFSGAFLAPMERAGIRVINLHPALPGAYDGARAIERAWEDCKAGRAQGTGVMVHYVIERVDRGAPIMVEEIKWEGEGLAQLEERIHACEHELIVRATAKVVGEIVAGGE